MKKNIKNIKIPRALIIGSALFVIVSLSMFDGFLAYTYQYKDKVYRGQKVGQYDVSGMSLSQLENKINSFQSEIEKSGITIISPKKKFHLLTAVVSTDASTATDLITFRNNDLAKRIYSEGKKESLFNNLKKILVLLAKGDEQKLVFEYNSDLIKDVLADFFQDEEILPTNATIKINSDDSLKVIAEKKGSVFNYETAISQINERLSMASLEEVKIDLTEKSANVNITEANALKTKIVTLIESLPLTLKYNDKTWSITKKIVINGLELDAAFPANTPTDVLRPPAYITLKPSALDELFEKIAKDIEIPAQDAKFKMDNGKAVEFQTSQNGLSIDQQKTIININNALNDSSSREIAVVTKDVVPTYTNSTAFDLGIKELVAEGRTSFAGSPTNRRINIKVAAQKLNGIIIKPGDTFTTINTVGPVDGKNGYLPELVIKGNRTLPEFGGGLCQIGTTLFRLVLNTGLPVLERRNHSYRVPYYEPPAGMDATIYEPKPDFRFSNDFSTPLLLQARIEGDNLIFEFYGTKDNRVATSTTPRIYNYVNPGPKKIIETDSLKPGETKCIERAHTGADAEFTYTVKYANGETKSEVFKSHYKPWQEVCLVGKASTKTE